MRKLLILISLFLCHSVFSQELPTIPASGFSFPLGSKFTIKLVKTDSLVYDFQVTEFERFYKTIDSDIKKNLFDAVGKDSTITFYFCYATYGKTEKERKENMQIILTMKNYSKLALDYISEIQVKEDGKYEKTSNVGMFPGIVTTEQWPHMIRMIAIRNISDNKRFK